MSATALALLGAAPATPVSHSLPSALTEISGLAVAGPDSVFTHDDEHAIIYEIALSNGRVRRAFALGSPTIEGDFEGIASAHGTVFLVTSDGLIYAARPGRNAQRVPYRVFDSGVGARCEIEGLSQGPDPRELLLLCKRARGPDRPGRLDIYRWPIGGGHAYARPLLSIATKALLGKDEQGGLAPSGLEWDARRQRLIIVAGRNRLLLLLSPDGRLLARRALSKSRHPQVEGVTVMPDGRLVLADEGGKLRRARLSAYPFD